MSAISSNAVLRGGLHLEKYVFRNSSNTLDISDLENGIYLCNFDNLSDEWYYYNVGILCKWSDYGRTYNTIIANSGTGQTPMQITINGDTLTTNLRRITDARFYRIGYNQF